MSDGSRLPWSRFVALGDSLTEGVGDPVGGSLLGWADRLAAALRVVDPKLEYTNLARRSETTLHVRDGQLEPALKLAPNLVSVAVGMNDLLSRSFDAEEYGESLDSIVTPLAATGATVMMGTFPEHLPLLRLAPPKMATGVRTRLRSAAEAVRAVARHHDAILLEAPGGWRYSMAECSIDGCHPNARGHAHIAEIALAALCERAGLEGLQIDRTDCGLWRTSVGHLRWLAAEGFLRRPPGVLAWWKQGGSA